jgi:hypothetical protein
MVVGHRMARDLAAAERQARQWQRLGRRPVDPMAESGSIW